MALKIKLTRLGDKKSPFYRVVVAESRSPRDGKFVEVLGTFDPKSKEFDAKIDKERMLDWISKGATPTDTVNAILVKAGIIKAEPFKAKPNAKPPKPKAKPKKGD